MSLFFDAAWFDARLAERGLDRGALAGAAGISREELHLIVVNEREATGRELSAFAAVLNADIVEVSLRSGVSTRGAAPSDQTGRLDDLDARLDRIDRFLEDLDSDLHKSADARDYSSPGLERRVAVKR